MLQQQIMCTCIPHPGLTLFCQLSSNATTSAVLIHPGKAIGGHVLRAMIRHGNHERQGSGISCLERPWDAHCWACAAGKGKQGMSHLVSLQHCTEGTRWQLCRCSRG